MSASVISPGDQRSELERAEPKQRADSSSVLRSEACEAHAGEEGEAGAPARSAGVSASLLYQRSNNCIEEDEDEIESASNQLSKGGSIFALNGSRLEPSTNNFTT